MGRERKVAPGPSAGDQAKERHRKDRNGVYHDWSAPLPRGLVARPHVTQPKHKHHTYLEFVENKDKKKKLEFEITTDKHPPPGFEFVPIGNPSLTTACKELSRERDAMIFIVSTAKNDDRKGLSLALNRVGHHIRQTIVEQARAALGDLEYIPATTDSGRPEPIPENQEEINNQADAAIRDLFPRIPNGDRQTIIEHSFKKGATMKGTPLVGLAPNISLSRRVQLAVLAHIRHTHTRYDRLLRETSYVNARKAVESLCLDILVKWRGDEETGRDQLDEILREVVVISDSEDGEGEDAEDEDEGESDSSRDTFLQTSPFERLPARRFTSARPPGRYPQPTLAVSEAPRRFESEAVHDPQPRHLTRAAKRDRRAAKKANRGFLRYQAVRDQVWHDAIERQRHAEHEPATHSLAPSLPPQRPAGQAPEAYPSRESPPGSPAYHTSPAYEESTFFIRRDDSRPAAATHTQYVPRNVDGHLSGGEHHNGLRPMAGSGVRASLAQPPPAPRSVVSYRNDGDGDLLVRSIEPWSPEASHPQYPPLPSPSRPEPYHPEREPAWLSSPVRLPSQRTVPTYLPPEPSARNHVLDERRGYITISDDSSSPRTISSAVRQGDTRESFPIHSRSYSAAYPETRRFGTEPRPFPMLGPVRPLVSGYEPERPHLAYTGYQDDQPRAPESSVSPTRWRAGQAALPRSVSVSGRDGRDLGRDVDSHVPPEFVTVSGVFPRPFPQPHASHRTPHDSHDSYSGHFEIGHQNTARAEDPMLRREYVQAPPRPMDRQTSYPREDDRVVWVEYVDHDYRHRNYHDHPARPYDLRGRVLEQQGPYSVSRTLIERQHQGQQDPGVARRDRVIYLD